MNNQARRILAVDGGGSKTEIVLVHSELGKLETIERQSVQPFNSGKTLSDRLQSLEESIEEILRKADYKKEDIDSGLICLAGIGNSAVFEKVERWAQAHFDGRIAVVSDIELILSTVENLADDDEQNSVALIAGTGAIAAGRNGRADQDTMIAGGLGPLLGDEGGGFWIGKAAIQQVMKTLRGGETQSAGTDFTRQITQGRSDKLARQFLADFLEHATPIQEVASLARIVNELAEQGNPLAIAILEEAAENLAELVRQILGHWNRDEDYNLAIAGGAIVHSKLLMATFKERMTNIKLPVSVYVIDDPVMAAAHLASGI